MCNVYVLLAFIVMLCSVRGTCSEAKPDTLRTPADVAVCNRITHLINLGWRWTHACRDGAIPRSQSLPPDFRFRGHKMKKINLKRVIEAERDD